MTNSPTESIDPGVMLVAVTLLVSAVALGVLVGTASAGRSPPLIVGLAMAFLASIWISILRIRGEQA